MFRLVAVTVLAFVAGAMVGVFFLADVVRTPCWQVVADLEPAGDTLAETFGDGEEGAAALATIREAAQQRPDCFSPSDRESIDQMTNTNPSDGATPTATEASSG